MVRLSVNVNKVATLRNSRTRQPAGHSMGSPSVLGAVRVCVDAGAPGITVHARADARHITLADVREIAAELASVNARRGVGERVEYNIEGDPRDELVALVESVRPDQMTVVPVAPGEITSQAGWPPDAPAAELRRVIARANAVGTRVSVFVDPQPDPIRWAADLGAQRVELFTEPFAQAFARGDGQRSFAAYVAAAELAVDLGLGVNAGHDLDLDNLVLFRTLPGLDEVSIGHAIMARALFSGLGAVVGEYLAVLAGAPRGA
jgi:pyridoxine 5-phosphate synthase